MSAAEMRLEKLHRTITLMLSALSVLMDEHDEVSLIAKALRRRDRRASRRKAVQQ